jgi:hypothetical protein
MATLGPGELPSRMRVGLLPLSYIALPTECVNLDEDYPIVGRMSNLKHFRRSTRCIEGSIDGRFAIRLASAQQVAAVTLEHMNFQQCYVEVSDGSVPIVWEPFGPGSGGIPGRYDTVMEDIEDGRRKLLVAPDEPALGVRNLRVSPGPVDDGVEDAIKLGSCGVWGELEQLVVNPFMPYRKVYDDDAEVDKRLGAGEDIGGTSPTQTVINFPVSMYRDDLLAFEQYMRIARSPRGRVILFDENQGDLTKFYHCRRSGTVSSQRTPGVMSFDGFQLREVG